MSPTVFEYVFGPEQYLRARSPNRKLISSGMRNPLSAPAAYSKYQAFGIRQILYQDTLARDEK